MATPTMAIMRILQARTEEAPPPADNLERYKPAYREVLVAIRGLGGDPAIDELTDWIVGRTHDTGRLPTPSAVREQAREICRERGISIPEGSPLTP